MLPAGMCVTTCLHNLSAKQEDQEATSSHDQLQLRCEDESFSVSMRANGFATHIIRVPVSVPIGAHLGSDDCIVRQGLPVWACDA